MTIPDAAVQAAENELRSIICEWDRRREFFNVSPSPKNDFMRRQAEGLTARILYAIEVAPSPRAQALEEEAFQHRVKPWMLACFGEEISNDKLERCDRFIEEALELVQAIGYSADRAHVLVDYVFNRDIGEPHQEVGGVMVTLAALCLASGLDMNKAGEDELARIWTKVEKIRAKQVAKPTGSALPIALSSHPVANALPQDVINLVIAARDAFDAISGCGIGAEIEADLDKALKEFSERVPYENEPDALPASPGASE